MFTIGHLSDAHLGYASGRKRIDENGYNVRENDAYVAFNKAVDQMIEAKIDCLLVAGDIFHTPRPKNHTVIIAQEGLRRVANAGIPVYILAGNHDATDVRMEIPSSMLLNEPNSQIYSYSEPYVVREIHPGIFMHFVSHHAYVDQAETMDELKLVDGAVNILASHGSCYDTNMGMVLHSPQEPREVIIPQEIMDMPWDYTLLGHIHERGWIGSKDPKSDTAGRKQFYGGSLIRRGFSDKVCALGRGWTKWTVHENHEITPEFYVIEERPQYDMTPINTKGKTSVEIEKEILTQLKAIEARIIKEFGEMNNDSMPIVRQTLLGVNATTRLSINWRLFTPYTSQFLSHSFKTVREETIDTTGMISAEALSNGDIIAVFKEWNKTAGLDIENNIKDDVLTSATNFLKASRNEELNKD